MFLLRRVTILPFLALLTQGAFAEDAPAPPALLHGPAQSVEAPTATPEPNTALLAGLGGLTLLFFALRRK